MTPSPVSHLIIIAGGPGLRLLPLVADLPKVLVPVDGKPVLGHQLDLAAASGIQDVIVFAGYLSEKVSAFVDGRSNSGVDVRVLVEEEPRGTAGAVLQCLDTLPEHFYVLYGDIMVAADLRRMAAFHLERGADFTALVQPTDHPHDSDLVEIAADGRIVAIHLYPHPPDGPPATLANAALYVVRRDALLPWAGAIDKKDFVKDLMTGLVARDARVFGYQSGEFVKDMGTPERLIKVEAAWRSLRAGSR
jgi:NDP-sugar pyrophosphorylase family protein